MLQREKPPTGCVSVSVGTLFEVGSRRHQQEGKPTGIPTSYCRSPPYFEPHPAPLIAGHPRILSHTPPGRFPTQTANHSQRGGGAVRKGDAGQPGAADLGRAGHTARAPGSP